jgi:SpoIIAA-like
MPFAVEVLEEDRLIRARWYGESNSDEARAAVAVIKSEVKAHPVEGVLLDFRDVRKLTPDEASDVGTEFAHFLGRRRLAIVTSSPAQGPLAQMIAQHAEPGGVGIDVFRDERDALNWLHSPDLD